MKDFVERPAVASPGPDRQARLNRIASALVVIAVALPIAVAATGFGEPEWAIKQLLRIVAMYVVLGGIGHLATRSDSGATRTKVRFGVIVVICVLNAMGSFATARAHHEATTFARLMLEHDRTYIPAINDINQRFAQFDPSEGIELASMVTADGIENGRVNADRYVRLLDKRRDIMTAHAAEVRHIVDVSSSGEQHDMLASKMDAAMAQTMQVFGELDAAQRGHAAAIDALFVFCEQHRGSIAVKGDALQFATPALEADYRSRVEAITNAEAAMQAAEDKAEKANAVALKAREEALPAIRKAAGE